MEKIDIEKRIVDYRVDSADDVGLVDVEGAQQGSGVVRHVGNRVTHALERLAEQVCRCENLRFKLGPSHQQDRDE